MTTYALSERMSIIVGESRSEKQSAMKAAQRSTNSSPLRAGLDGREHTRILLGLLPDSHVFRMLRALWLRRDGKFSQKEFLDECEKIGKFYNE